MLTYQSSPAAVSLEAESPAAGAAQDHMYVGIKSGRAVLPVSANQCLSFCVIRPALFGLGKLEDCSLVSHPVPESHCGLTCEGSVVMLVPGHSSCCVLALLLKHSCLSLKKWVQKSNYKVIILVFISGNLEPGKSKDLHTGRILNPQRVGVPSLSTYHPLWSVETSSFQEVLTVGLALAFRIQEILGPLKEMRW